MAEEKELWPEKGGNVQGEALSIAAQGKKTRTSRTFRCRSFSLETFKEATRLERKFWMRQNTDLSSILAGVM